MKKYLLFFSLLLWALPASADMDYRCLKDCVNASTASQSCMKQCSYNMTETIKPVRSIYEPVRTPHDQFTPPVPSNQLLVHPPSSDVPLSKDYSCVSQCQKNAYPYQFCEEKCLVAIRPMSAGNLAAPSPAGKPASPTTINSGVQPAGAAGK